MGKSKKQNKKKFNLIDWLDKYIFRSKNLSYMLGIYLAYIFISTLIHNHQLREYGIESKAYVYAKHDPTRGGTAYKYRFEASNDYGQKEYFKGTSLYKYSIGDSITIIYLPYKPKVNATKEELYEFQNLRKK